VAAASGQLVPTQLKLPLPVRFVPLVASAYCVFHGEPFEPTVAVAPDITGRSLAKISGSPGAGVDLRCLHC
jgi:hypothetical protein